MEAKQTSQKAYHDKHAKERNFVAGESIYTKNYGYWPKWVPGLIHGTTGPVSYTVLLGDGKLVRRHVDQLFSRQESELSVLSPEPVPVEECGSPTPLPKMLGQDTGPGQEGDSLAYNGAGASEQYACWYSNNIVPFSQDQEGLCSVSGYIYF